MLARRRIKFIWGGAKVVRGDWHVGLFGYYERVEGDRDSGMAISIRGLLLWGMLVGSVLYTAGATALTYYWQRNPRSLLTWEDAFLYPVRREVVAEKKGRSYIAEGLALAKAGQWPESARYLQFGLALSPGDQGARIVLARALAESRQWDAALAVLQTARPKEFPARVLIETLVTIATKAENFAAVVDVADRYTNPSAADVTAAERAWLAEKKWEALMADRRWAEALTAAHAAGNPRWEVEALLAAGKADEALSVLGQLPATASFPPAVQALSRARALRVAGRTDEMNQALEDVRALAAADPRVAAQVIREWSLAGRAAQARAALAEFAVRFGAKADNFSALVATLGEDVPRALLEQADALATARGFTLVALRQALVEEAAGRGDWTTAEADLARVPRTLDATVTAEQRAWRTGMRALLDAVQSPGLAGSPALLLLLREQPWPAKDFRRNAAVLLRAGLRDAAGEVLAIGRGAYPASTALRAAQEAFDRAPVASQANSAGVAATPDATGPLGEKVFFAELERLVAAKAWEQAEGLVRRHRNVRPVLPWLESRDAELRLRAIRIEQGRGDFSGMRADAGIYLNGEVSRAEQIVGLAKEFAAAGDRDGAWALVRTVLHKHPDLASARQAAAEWETPTADATSR